MAKFLVTKRRLANEMMKTRPDPKTVSQFKEKLNKVILEKIDLKKKVNSYIQY
jgi:hypothetical protein